MFCLFNLTTEGETSERIVDKVRISMDKSIAKQNLLYLRASKQREAFTCESVSSKQSLC